MEQVEDHKAEQRRVADGAAERDAHNAAEWEKHSKALLTELRALRDGIDAELNACNAELAKRYIRSMERGQQQNKREELAREKAVVDGAIASMEHVGAKVSQEDRSRIRAAAEDTRDAVRTWWTKRKEMREPHTAYDDSVR